MVLGKMQPLNAQELEEFINRKEIKDALSKTMVDHTAPKMLKPGVQELEDYLMVLNNMQPFSAEDLEAFITTKMANSTWPNTTYLMVECAAPPKMQQLNGQELEEFIKTKAKMDATFLIVEDEALENIKPFNVQQLEEFMKARDNGWDKTAHVIVECNMERYYYKNNRDYYAEELFIQDFQGQKFPPGAKFELYMNYTPCVVHPGRESCCDKLVKVFNGSTKPTIYAVALFRDDEVPTTGEKFQFLKDKGIFIKPLGKERFLSLFGQYDSFLASKLLKFTYDIGIRDRKTANFLQKIK
eukprot:Em0003g1484a